MIYSFIKHFFNVCHDSGLWENSNEPNRQSQSSSSIHPSRKDRQGAGGIQCVSWVWGRGHAKKFRSSKGRGSSLEHREECPEAVIRKLRPEARGTSQRTVRREREPGRSPGWYAGKNGMTRPTYNTAALSRHSWRLSLPSTKLQSDQRTLVWDSKTWVWSQLWPMLTGLGWVTPHSGSQASTCKEAGWNAWSLKMGPSHSFIQPTFIKCLYVPLPFTEGKNILLNKRDNNPSLKELTF